MAGNLNSVATYIKGLGFGAITVFDLRDIPEAVWPQDCPVLMPDTDPQFMSDLAIERITLKPRRWDLQYRLHYLLIYQTVAEGVTLYEQLPGMTDAFGAVLDTLMANELPTGAYDIRPIGAPYFGTVMDASGTTFWGCKFELWVQELIEG